MKVAFFALIPLILSIGITPAFSLQPEDIETECREGQVLVYRISNQDYICTSFSAASLWTKLGMAELPIDKIIRFLPTKLDPQKAAGVDTVLGVTYSDIGMDFTLHVRNSILAVTNGVPENPDMILTLDSDTHKLIVGGHLGVLDAIDSGQAELSGNVDELVDFLNLFDNVSVSTIGIG